MVEKKIGDILNRLNKTREERFPDLQQEREKRDRREQSKLRIQQEEMVIYNAFQGYSIYMLIPVAM